MMDEEIKQRIRETELLIHEANNMLNKALAEYKEFRYEEDRNILRSIRDENIKTILLIQRMELVGLI